MYGYFAVALSEFNEIENKINKLIFFIRIKIEDYFKVNQ